MKLEVTITETITPKEVADSICKYDMDEIDVLISDATGRMCDNRDCGFALEEEFNNLDDEKKIKWFTEVLKEIVRNFENVLDN